MRDLYKRLGLKPYAPIHVIKEALNLVNHRQINTDIETVLTDPAKKEIYDITHRAVFTVGRLRSRLGLTHTENWTGPAAEDFTVQVKPFSRYEALMSKLRPPKPSLEKSTHPHQRQTHRPQPQSFSKPSPRVEKSGDPVATVFYVIFSILVIFCIAAWIGSQPASESKNKSSFSEADRSTAGIGVNSARDSRAPVKPAFTEPPLPLPPNFEIRRFTAAEPIAPLQIHTRPGSHFLVKLEDLISKEPVLTIFIHGGETTEIKVPLGSYVMKYASGEVWYGYEHYFGPDTVYSKADNVFKFKRSGSKISGYTVTLYRIKGGNLHTHRIPGHDF